MEEAHQEGGNQEQWGDQYQAGDGESQVENSFGSWYTGWKEHGLILPKEERLGLSFNPSDIHLHLVYNSPVFSRIVPGKGTNFPTSAEFTIKIRVLNPQKQTINPLALFAPSG